MCTILNSAILMDAGLLFTAGNETSPLPQTPEHPAAVEIMELEDTIILQST